MSRKLKGQEYAFSTDSNLYLYDLESGQTKNLTEDNPGYDTDPVFSPDGKTLAWLSMPTAKYESDKKRLMVRDMATGNVRDLTEGWDRWPEGLAWDANGKSIVFNGYSDGVMPIFRINTETCKIDTLASGVYDYVNVNTLADGRVIAMRHSMLAPNEIIEVSSNGVKELTQVNKDLLAQLKDVNV